MNLLALQQQWMQATTQVGDIDASDLPIEPKARLKVYQNNYFASLHALLEETYPCVASLLGAETFKTVSQEFWQSAAPQSAVMLDAGHDFAAFLAQHPHLQELGYLRDVAQLERDFNKTYYCAWEAAIPAEALAAIPASELIQHPVRLQPSLFVVRSAFAIFDIWQMIQQDSDTGVNADIAQSVVIVNEDNEPCIQHIEDCLGHFIQALQEHQTIEQAFTQTTEQHADFDLAAALAFLIQHRLITGIMQDTA